jgi:hypothetical protein
MGHAPIHIIFWACIALQVLSLVPRVETLVAQSPAETVPSLQFRDELGSNQPLLVNTTDSGIEDARGVVRAAITQMTKLNKARLENHARGPSSETTLARRNGDDSSSSLLEITPAISHAAALVAEADMAASLSDGSFKLSRRAAGSFWMEDIRRQGTVPWGSDATYKVSGGGRGKPALKNPTKRARASQSRSILLLNSPSTFSQLCEVSEHAL